MNEKKQWWSLRFFKSKTGLSVTARSVSGVQFGSFCKDAFQRILHVDLRDVKFVDVFICNGGSWSVDEGWWSDGSGILCHGKEKLIHLVSYEVRALKKTGVDLSGFTVTVKDPRKKRTRSNA